MEVVMEKKVLKLGGLSCNGCETIIKNKLLKQEGIKEVQVNYQTGILQITFDSNQISLIEIRKTIEKLGYYVKDGSKQRIETEKNSYNELIIIGIILFGIYTVIKNTIGFNFIPEINSNMSYSILFIVGLLTSLHCVAMCGGINLSLCMSYQSKSTEESKFAKIKPSLLYNTGRVISYTILGGLVGALGSVFQLSNTGSALISILAGIFMTIMGLNMLNVFPWLRRLNPHMPKGLVKKINGLKQGKGPFIVGLLNGFIPCGPLQAMQIYALGKGSFMAGALSMFLFSLGTVPLLFAFGAVGSMLSAKFTKNMLKVSAVLVIILGVVMMNRGMSFTGVSLETVLASNTASEENVSVVGSDKK
jgi:sulfite exporter TauE/SafE/copper chaperone CopZ